MIEIRELTDHREVPRVQELQAEVWGRSELDIVPQGLTVAFIYQGGLVAGAYDGGKMVGFVMGIPTANPRKQHSHMLGVLPSHRGSNVAVQLKLYQREWCLQRGIEQVVWSFDPLRAVNANFNIRKLGAVVREYHPNLYGQMSGVNAGVDSDRVLAEWDLNADRVVHRLERPGPQVEVSKLPCINQEDHNDLTLDAPALLYQLPADFGALVQQNLSQAQKWRAAGREALVHYLKRGYTIEEFVRAEQGLYLLRRQP